MIAGLRAYRLRQRRSPAVAAASADDAALPRRARRPIWLHASEPGEHDVLKVLAGQIADFADAPDCLLTGGSGNPGPGDDPVAIEQFLTREQPLAVVLAGALLPPNLIEHVQARGIGLFLVNALGPAAPGHWRFWPGFTRALLCAFTQIHVRNASAEASLKALVRGAVPVLNSGALARFPPAPGCNHSELEAMRQALANRPVWFAYSLPAAEVELAIQAHAQALRRSHRLLMIAAPRDPRDGEGIAATASAMGFVCARRSLDEEITATTQVYVADAEDEPGLFLRLSQISYLGGSLSRDLPTPGPLAAAALGSALIFGPQASAEDRGFLEQLRRSGGGRRIGSAGDLGNALGALLSPEVGADAALKAWTLATEGSDATYHLARGLCDWLKLHHAERP
mgnify:CR=1 FL=1